MSDAEGMFNLELNAGECKVKVVANEFEPFKTNELLAANETAEVVYYVMPKVVGYETVVRGARVRKKWCGAPSSAPSCRKSPARSATRCA